MEGTFILFFMFYYFLFYFIFVIFLYRKTCPLYSDINILHREGVINGAQRAKQELGNVQLKYDPSENI